MLLRDAVPGDLEALVALERAALGDDAWSERLLGDALAAPGAAAYVVAVVDDAMVGYAALDLGPVAAGIGDLLRIAVDARQRRRGIATALLGDVVARATAGGAERLLLEVRADNASALAFYAAGGFEEIDRRRGYYRGTDAVVLQRSLG
ncbi:MAG: ribosomal-protein-alanine acetyltransferase [Nocardioides sp.]|nr:ribosomal-protein-alanine acetyltransferase [Nocardioides sp.]